MLLMAEGPEKTPAPAETTATPAEAIATPPATTAAPGNFQYK